MGRREFSTAVRRQAWIRCGGPDKPVCERPGCCRILQPRGFAFDHIQPDALGGKPTLENCMVLCAGPAYPRPCHQEKTRTKDMPAIRKSARLRDAYFGLAKPKRKRTIGGGPAKPARPARPPLPRRPLYRPREPTHD